MLPDSGPLRSRTLLARLDIVPGSACETTSREAEVSDLWHEQGLSGGDGSVLDAVMIGRCKVFLAPAGRSSGVSYGAGADGSCADGNAAV